jgi:hypothetical protein
MSELHDPSWNTRLERVIFGGTILKPGSRVRLRPSRRADAFDLILFGHTATVESIEQDFEGRIYLAVTVDDDPGRDFGERGPADRRYPAHRFFFSLEEIEPIGAADGGFDLGRQEAR